MTRTRSSVRAAPAAPRTWFAPRHGRELADPDREAALAVLSLLVLVTAPVVLVAAGVGSVAARLGRVRWWQAVTAAVLAAAVVLVVWGLAGTAARYTDGYRHLWRTAGGLPGLGGALRDGWPAFVGALAPGSVPLALAVVAAVLGYGELRRPSWRATRVGESKTTRRRTREHSRLATVSTTTPLGEDGRLGFGVEVATGRAVRLGEGDLSAHGFVAGASRSGKTTALLCLARAVVAGWDRPLIFVDLKGDPDVVAHLQGIAGGAGKSCWVWTIEGGATWNPLAHGDPSLLKDKLVGLEDWSEPHYKLAAARFLQLVFTALAVRPTPDPPTLAEVVAFLDLKRLAGLSRSLPEEAGTALLNYVDALPRDQVSGVAGLATRLALLTESTAGPHLEPGPDALDLAQVARTGGVVVFSLDSGRWPELAAQVGALVVQDLKAVCGEALHGERGRWYVMIDEFSALAGTQLLGLLARGAAAGCSVVLATQELADLAAAGDGFREQVLGNTALKVAFRQDVPESAECWSAMAGTETGWAETIQAAHRSASPLNPATGHATGVASLRQVEEFLTHPNVIKRLPQGRCLLIRKHPAFSAQVLDVVAPQPSVVTSAMTRG